MEAVKGNKLIYLFREHSKASTTEGTTIAFTTENSRSVSKDAETTVTKDGTIRTPGQAEIEISATAMLAIGDTTIDDLEKAMLDDALLDIWEANLEEAGTGDNKFKGKYYQGYLTSLEKTSSAEGYVECSLTFGINGNGADGEVTVSTEQQEIAAYVFQDTTRTNS